MNMSHALTDEVLSEEEEMLLQETMDRFYIGRIGNRMMLSQHVALSRAAAGLPVPEKMARLGSGQWVSE